MDSPPLQQLAGRLGVERRRAVRIRYPASDCAVLPAISVSHQNLRVHDISVGGCCLIDPKEVLGSSIGSNVHLVLSWGNRSVSVHGRIVARVDHKRHIQFLNLPHTNAEELRKAISPGALGLEMRPIVKAIADGPIMEAREVWSSLRENSVIIEDHVHRLAEVHLSGEKFSLYKNAWPLKEDHSPLHRTEVDHLLLFLCNIPQPSPLLKALVAHVESMSAEGAR